MIETIIAFEVLSVLNIGILFYFILKKRFRKLRKKRVYKLSLTSTLKRNESILTSRNK